MSTDYDEMRRINREISELKSRSRSRIGVNIGLIATLIFGAVAQEQISHYSIAAYTKAKTFIADQLKEDEPVVVEADEPQRTYRMNLDYDGRSLDNTMRDEFRRGYHYLYIPDHGWRPVTYCNTKTDQCKLSTEFYEGEDSTDWEPTLK